MTHNLKILPEYYRVVLSGHKTFEVRFNDRDFKRGDLINLMEYDPDYCGGYTGRVYTAVITYVLTDERFVKKGYCIFSFQDRCRFKSNM